ncbi:hypothetical protein HYC85_028091 [Camellia sinensis]|uniref:Uncharacterized protein n=1 Tax=Camellia sinensis TaxID=4442 RepID=A0A7J7FU56_CAMSI|nr:hypothetical protein HYC85_028091 [Camellia sinensis]
MQTTQAALSGAQPKTPLSGAQSKPLPLAHHSAFTTSKTTIVNALGSQLPGPPLLAPPFFFSSFIYF